LEKGYNSKVLVLHKTFDAPEVYEYEKKKNRLPKIVSWPVLFFKLVLLKFRIPVSRLQRFQYKLNYLRSISSPVYSFPLSDYDLTKHPLVIEADLIHLHWTSGFLDWPSFFKNILKPVILTVHDENLYYGGFHYKKEQIENIRVYRKLEEQLIDIKQRSIRECKNLTIVSISKMMLDLSLSSGIVKNRKHWLINNSVDHCIFKPFDKNFCRNVFRLPRDKIILIFISYYLKDKNKGLTELVIALNELNRPDIVLFAVGIGKAEVESSFEIYYPGAINDPRILTLAYSASDIYIMPSFQEGFAQTPLEAMACGIPVVVFPCSGTEELINEKNGVRADDFTTDSLKSSINLALNTSYNNDWIRNNVISLFGIENTIKQYEEGYQAAINEEVG
jgi:glycosyltransferase involved in cell wall biosynthesis